MRLSLFTAVLLLAAGTALSASQAAQGPEPAAVSPQGSTSILGELASSERETERLDNRLVFVGCVQAAIFLLQLIAFVVQAIKLHQTVEAARVQSRDMARSVEHAARGATAMEAVAEAMTQNSRTTSELLSLQKEVFPKNLRAYVTVQLQGYLPENPAADNRHEVRTLIKNSGNTPARAIFVTGRLRVLPAPLPPDFDLTLPPTNVETYGMIAAHESFYIRHWLEGFLSEAENAAIATQHGLALYIYGVIRYKDIFDQDRMTEFCNMISSDSLGNALWISVPGRNKGT